MPCSVSSGIVISVEDVDCPSSVVEVSVVVLQAEAITATTAIAANPLMTATVTWLGASHGNEAADTGRLSFVLMNSFDLSGTVALVTGGNGGIGLGMAEGLAAAGADVCIWGRSAEKNATASDVLDAYGNGVDSIVTDVSDEAAVEDAFAATIERFGKIDACFANAGVPSWGSRFADATPDEFRAVTSVNLEGVFLTLRAAVRHLMDRREGGSLVATSSLSSLLGMPRGAAYASSKAAVSAMVRSIAVEYGRFGIRANAILPGWIETDMTAGLFTDERFQQSQLGRTSMRRWGKPDDFAGIAVYLASNASRFHTGDTIVIDGGYLVD